MLRIEFEPPSSSPCDCCGSTSVRLTRFVYRDGDAYAVYYAAFTPEHTERVVRGLAGLGEWGNDDVGPEARVAFAFEIRVAEEQFQVGIVDAKYSPWRDVTLLGEILNRAEALEHEWLSEVFHLTDHIVAEDQEVIHYFSDDGLGSHQG